MRRPARLSTPSSGVSWPAVVDLDAEVVDRSGVVRAALLAARQHPAVTAAEAEARTDGPRASVAHAERVGRLAARSAAAWTSQHGA